MKQIVLSEGRRDVRLVELFYEEINPGVSFDTFHAEAVPSGEWKFQETQKIRNFIESRNPYDVLAKSENGKQSLLTMVVKLINFLVSRDSLSLTVLIDLDGGDVDALIDLFDARVRRNYAGQALGVRSVGRIDQSPVQVAHRAELIGVDDSTPRGDFDIIAFRHALEFAVDIDGEEVIAEERDKLRSFVTDDRVSGPMRSVLV